MCLSTIFVDTCYHAHISLAASLSKDNLPSFKIWAKENGLYLPRTKHESETMYKKKKPSCTEVLSRARWKTVFYFC